MDNRYWVRDEHDGVWGEAPTQEAADALLARLNETENALGKYTLRVDDMDDL